MDKNNIAMDNSLFLNRSNSIRNNNFIQSNYFSCCNCFFPIVLLNINPYNNIIKYKCSIHGIIKIYLRDYFHLLNNNLKNINISQHLKCNKHIDNNIICFNYEKKEFYCLKCYRFNKDKEYDIRFFKDVNFPNEININEIEFIDSHFIDNSIQYLKKKNIQYNNIIKNYYNLINLNNIFINSYNNIINKKIDIINIKHYINCLKFYDIKEDQYFNNINNQELKQTNIINHFNKKYSLNLSEDGNYINLVNKNLSNEGFNYFNNNIGEIKNPIIEILIFQKIILVILTL